MIKKIFRYALVLSTALFMVACARVQPITNFQNQPVPHNMTATQVQKSIANAGTIKGWNIYKVKPGLMRASIRVRQHQATASIPYSSKDYSIMYESSHNLMAQDGMIHRNYNKWVTLLNEKIQRQLATQQIKK
jgi:hypothetical protein